MDGSAEVGTTTTLVAACPVVCPPGAERWRLRRDAGHRAIAYAMLAIPTAWMLLASLLFRPSDIESGRVKLSPTCTTMMLLGRPCPTCGLTRAFTAIGHGDVAQAQRYHRAALISYIATCGAFVWGSVGVFLNMRERRRLLHDEGRNLS